MWFTIILVIIAIFFISKDFIFTKLIENSKGINEYINFFKENISIKIIIFVIVLLYFLYDLKYYYKIIIIILILLGFKYNLEINYILNQLWKLKNGDIFINHFNII